MTEEFKKYKKRGAYHWRMISRNLKEHRPFAVARYKICLEMLGEVANKKIVDVGCGDGALTGLIAKAGGIVIGIDPSKEGLALARQMFEKHSLKGTFCSSSTELVDRSCDAVVCADVIEHVENTDEMLQEIFRILKLDGIAVISTPIRLSEEPWDKEHIKEWFPSEFKSLCEKYGEIIEMRNALPIAAQDLLYYREGIIGWLLHLSLQIRSAWIDDNYLLKWKGLDRYHVLQVAKILKQDNKS